MIRALALAVRFFLELSSLAAFGFWGHAVGSSPVGKLVFAVVAPVAAAVLWGLLIAPKAAVPWPQTVRDLLGLVVFVMAAAALHHTGQEPLALALAVVAVADTAVLLVGWERE